MKKIFITVISLIVLLGISTLASAQNTIIVPEKNKTENASDKIIVEDLSSPKCSGVKIVSVTYVAENKTSKYYLTNSLDSLKAKFGIKDAQIISITTLSNEKYITNFKKTLSGTFPNASELIMITVDKK